MQRPLDPRRFKQNHYDRPNQDWVCGHTAEGRGCPLGPDARGKCRHTGECVPAKKGDRWTCMRTRGERRQMRGRSAPERDLRAPDSALPAAALGSAFARLCSSGCSLRSTTGALLIFLGRAAAPALDDPGALTNAHATSASKCSDCHAVDRSGARLACFLHWARQATPGRQRALSQMPPQLGDHPLDPHSVTPAGLIALQRKWPASQSTAASKPVMLRASRALNPKRTEAGSLACQTCHQEHHGRQFNLKALSNAQCQSCHASSSPASSKGIPISATIPTARAPDLFRSRQPSAGALRRTKEKAPDLLRRLPRAWTVGAIHAREEFQPNLRGLSCRQIEGEGMTVKGVAFFTVPGIDAETLAAKRISIGEWPKFADGKLTPFMEVPPRAGTRRCATAEQQLQGVDLLDLTKATPEQMSGRGAICLGRKDVALPSRRRRAIVFEDRMEGRDRAGRDGGAARRSPRRAEGMDAASFRAR